MVAAELVACTCVPPQAVLANADADSFALAASSVQAPVAMGGAGAPAAGAADGAADMEEDTVSPRTLQQVSCLYSPYCAAGGLYACIARRLGPYLLSLSARAAAFALIFSFSYAVTCTRPAS